MPCQVGNEAARDSLKHSLAYLIRAAVLELIPSSGAVLSIHYDKRGAKMTIQYVGNDCAELREKIEALANDMCERNLTWDQIKLLPEDSEGLKSFDHLASSKEISGATIKKFTVNAGKEQIVLEYNVGASKAKESDVTAKAAVPAKAAAAQPKDCKVPKAASRTSSKPFAYDSVPQVSAQVTEELLALLAAEGIDVAGKADVLRAKLAGKADVLRAKLDVLEAPQFDLVLQHSYTGKSSMSMGR